ncbi:MAG: nucleotidyltransferase domain-containing protein [Vicinamibacterales bacterium]
MASDIEQQNDRIVELLRGELDDVIAVYRFGSTAHGTASTRSDTDIAVLAPKRLPPDLRFDTQERLATILGSDVDLVDLAAATPVMAVQVIGRGDLLYEGDRVARGQFEDWALGAYARLNEERRGILERVKSEGTVYGR